jgi:hypothetical protein
MKNLILCFVLVGSLNADVPALINYQGRLVDGVGNPITGAKTFQLDVFDAQTAGTLIYQETLDDVALDEDGAYSFQFGAGESRTQTSEIVATGDGETSFFQKVLGQTPVGVISVTDGTTTFTSTDTVTGEEPFTFTYTASVNRLNLICNEPPAVDVQYTASFRFAEDGITGALSSAAEHWMEVTIGGEKQTPRQRIVAVPFALVSKQANEATTLSKRERKIVVGIFFRSRVADKPVFLPDSGNLWAPLSPQSGIRKIKKIEFTASNLSQQQANLSVKIKARGTNGFEEGTTATIPVGSEVIVNTSLDLEVDFSDRYYTIEIVNTGGTARVSPITLTVEEWGD